MSKSTEVPKVTVNAAFNPLLKNATCGDNIHLLRIKCKIYSSIRNDDGRKCLQQIYTHREIKGI